MVFYLHRDRLNHKKSIWNPQVGFGQRMTFKLTLPALPHLSLCNFFLWQLEFFAVEMRILLKHNFYATWPACTEGFHQYHILHVNYIFLLSVSLITEDSLVWRHLCWLLKWSIHMSSGSCFVTDQPDLHHLFGREHIFSSPCCISLLHYQTTYYKPID